MKKSLFFLAAGAVALTACTSEEVIDDVVKKQNAITFENVVDKLSRADVEDLTATDLTHFSVFGYYITPNEDGTVNESSTTAIPVFDNVLVTRNDYNTWSYAGDLRYWVPGGRYFFYAYSCGNTNKLQADGAYGTFEFDMATGKTNTERALMIKDYLCDNTHQHDLIYASNTGADAEAGKIGSGIIAGPAGSNQTVDLKFKHILSKITAAFSSKFPDGYTVEVSNVSVQGIYNKGTYNPNAAQGWQDQSKSASFPYVDLYKTSDSDLTPMEIINEKDTDGNQIYKSTNSAYVMPRAYNQEDSNVSIVFNVKVLNKEQAVLNQLMTASFKPTWQAGYKYTYKIELSGSAAGLQAIAFLVVTDGEGNLGWNDGSSNDPIKVDGSNN